MKDPGASDEEGMSNSQRPEEPSGLVSEVDLVNGLPPNPPDHGRRGSWLHGLMGRRRGGQSGLAGKATEPLPGLEDDADLP